jgi:hypothetical protein
MGTTAARRARSAFGRCRCRPHPWRRRPHRLRQRWPGPCRRALRSGGPRRRFGCRPMPLPTGRPRRPLRPPCPWRGTPSLRRPTRPARPVHLPHRSLRPKPRPLRSSRRCRSTAALVDAGRRRAPHLRHPCAAAGHAALRIAARSGDRPGRAELAPHVRRLRAADRGRGLRAVAAGLGQSGPLRRRRAGAAALSSTAAAGATCVRPTSSATRG